MDAGLQSVHERPKGETMTSHADDRVLILGAGPVGLGAALELARFGVRSVVIEKHAGTSWHPKTRNFNIRTMEIARGWGAGVYRRMRAIDTPEGWKSPIRFMHSATGAEYGRIESKGFEGPGPDVSPCLPIMSSQEMIEAIMLDAALASGLVEVRFNVEATRLLEGAADSDTRVRLEVKDKRSRGTDVLEAPALVAADGASSTVRTQLGLQLEGPQGLSHVVNCYFRADIETRLKGMTGVLFFVANEGAQGVLQPLDAAGRWLCQINVPADQWSLDVFTKERARAWVRAAVGANDLEPEILSIGLWRMNATVVDRFVCGRVVMCGDAAHQFPPTGGLGVNTGLQGMHNAMWKLALCVQGRAGWPLLATYQTERRQVSQNITMQSLQNSINVARITAAARTGGDSGLSTEEVIATSRRYGNHLGVEFGAFYRSPAIVSDGTEPPQVADAYSDYAPSATPGCRAPHVWLSPGVSTHDLIGDGFTVLAAAEGEAWIEQARACADAFRIPIGAYRVGSAALRDDAGAFKGTYGLTASGAVLIRPDGHVGMRSAGAPLAADQLKQALKQILAR